MTAIVVSETSNKPIQNVEINVLNNLGDSTKTDSLGIFKIKSGLIGMMNGGRKFRFEVKKDGYEPKIIKTKFGIDTVKLKVK